MSGASEGGGGGGCGRGGVHSESFLHFDVVNGAYARYFPRIAQIYI